MGAPGKPVRVAAHLPPTGQRVVCSGRHSWSVCETTLMVMVLSAIFLPGTGLRFQ